MSPTSKKATCNHELDRQPRRSRARRQHAKHATINLAEENQVRQELLTKHLHKKTCEQPHRTSPAKVNNTFSSIYSPERQQTQSAKDHQHFTAVSCRLRALRKPTHMKIATALNPVLHIALGSTRHYLKVRKAGSNKTSGRCPPVLGTT